MITVLVLTLAWGMLERPTNKSLLWNQNAFSSLKSVQARSKYVSVYRSRKPSGLCRVNFPPPPPPVCTFPANSSVVRENISLHKEGVKLNEFFFQQIFLFLTATYNAHSTNNISRVPSSMDSGFHLSCFLCCRVSPFTLKRWLEDSEDCTYTKASKKPVTIRDEHVRNALYYFVTD